MADAMVDLAPRLRKVLIVDDNELNLDILEELLGHRLELRRATSGEQALAVLREFAAELVLLDIVMPGIDGYDTCRKITGDARTADTKVILLSARDQTCDRLRGYEVGASDYIVKPFDPTELSAKVDVFLALKSAQDESRAKSAFLANMSHEIRTPMTAILGYAEALRDASLSVDARDASIEAIWRNGQYLLELINNILDLSKLEARRLEVEQLDCRPAQIIADVLSMMTTRAEAAGLRISARYDGPVPAQIRSDGTRIKQILINLVGNAIKFTDRGEVQMVARLARDAGAGPMLEIDVVDTGVGIPAEQIEALCEPFVQADASVTRRFGGTGLGLSISKRLAALLGGELRIRSEVGRGSTFTMTVCTGDLTGKAMETELNAAPRCAVRAKGAGAASELSCRILLVEDGLDNQRLLSFVLRRAGAEVVSTENGQLGVDLAMAAVEAGRPFDVVLMDMQMPVLDGYAATRVLRERGYHWPIVALTAHAMPGDRERCLAAGCDRFASKPVDRGTLIATIHELVGGP